MVVVTDGRCAFTDVRVTCHRHCAGTCCLRNAGGVGAATVHCCDCQCMYITALCQCCRYTG
jgi:hypothetical protein